MQDNQQAPEKRVSLQQRANDALDVHSVFYTIQGEGPFAGTPAVFIRLAGCNLQCPKCDTDYTSKRQWFSVDELCEEVRRVAHVYLHPNELQYLDKEARATRVFRGLVVITGGEPFRQNIESLITALVQRGHYVQVETNGTLSPPGKLHTSHTFNHRQGFYIVVSPKAGRVHPQTVRSACAFKYVMSYRSMDPADGLPVYALDHSLGGLRVARPPAEYSGPVYLQPMDEQDAIANKMHLDACIYSCMRHGYILQLQTHKIIGME